MIYAKCPRGTKVDACGVSQGTPSYFILKCNSCILILCVIVLYSCQVLHQCL